MFNSVASGIIPICIFAAIAGVSLSLLRSRRLSLALAALAAVAISYLWFLLPSLLWPAAHTDPQGGWGLAITVLLSMFAVPVAVVALLVVQRRRAAKARAEA